MGNGWALLFDLIVTLTAALVLGVLAERVRQSAVIGYMIAGVVVGPSVTAWVQEPRSVSVIAELGVALLLFTIGLEFSLRRLVSLGRVALVGGTLQIASVMGVTALVALGFGVEWRGAVALGAVASLASTAVVIRLLTEHQAIDGMHGKSSVGVLLLQDVAVVPLVMLMTLLSGTAAVGKGAVAPGQLLLNTGLLIAALFFLVTLILPRLLDTATFGRNREFSILLAVGTCAAATWGAHAAGLSPALGAFLAGILLAESPFAHQMRADVHPFKTLFVTLFFASIGMVLDARFLLANLPLVLGVLVPVMVLKALLTAVSVRAFLPSFVTSLATGLVLSQVGEFSFVLAKVARDGGLLTDFLFQLVVSVTFLTLVATPYVVPRAVPWAKWAALRLFPAREVAAEERAIRPAREGHVIVVGYGMAGSRAAATVLGAGTDVLVVDVSPAAVRDAEADGFEAMIGDAGQDTILTGLGLPDAACLIVTVPEPWACAHIVGLAKTVCPHVRVVARARYHLMASTIRASGADAVVDEETLVGERLGEMIRSS